MGFARLSPIAKQLWEQVPNLYARTGLLEIRLKDILGKMLMFLRDVQENNILAEISNRSPQVTYQKMCQNVRKHSWFFYNVCYQGRGKSRGYPWQRDSSHHLDPLPLLDIPGLAIFNLSKGNFSWRGNLCSSNIIRAKARNHVLPDVSINLWKRAFCNSEDVRFCCSFNNTFSQKNTQESFILRWWAYKATKYVNKKNGRRREK